MPEDADGFMTNTPSGWLLRCVDGSMRPDAALDAPGPHRIGRRATSEILIEDSHASRDHALLEWIGAPPAGGDSAPPRSDAEWRLTDLGSRHGTWLNGVRLAHGRSVPLHHGDVIAIAGRLFHILDRARESLTTTVRLRARRTEGSNREDAAITRLDAARAESDAARRLSVLLKCAESLRLAEDDAALADAVLDAASAVSSVANLGVLRGLHAGAQDDEIEVVAQRGAIVADDGLRLSRSLIHRAMEGEPVRLTRPRGGVAPSRSVMRLGISEAICVPLLLGPNVTGFLYVDHREGGQTLSNDVCDFLIGLGRLASLALADLKRRDLERRQARVDAELAAAGAAHRWILPPRTGSVGPIRYVGECRPGPSTVGGDFFDVIELPEGRLALALGDVSGKGIGASILMTSAQGFLHASLRQHGDPARAISDLNAYLASRQGADRFITLWVGVFDPGRRILTYADAGHGLALLQWPDGSSKRLREGGGPPAGVLAEAQYIAASEPLRPGARVLVVSDGIVEQRAGGEGAPFGIESAAKAAKNEKGDAIAALFDALVAHAETSLLTDDATAVCVEW